MIGRDVKKLQVRHPEFIAGVRKNYRWNFIALILDSSIYAFSVSALSQDTIVPYFVAQLTNKRWVIGLAPAIYYFGYFLPQLIGAFLINGKKTRKRFILRTAIAERIGILAIALIAQSYGLLSDNVILALFLCAYMVFSLTNGMIMPGYSDFISKSIIYNRGVFFGFVNGLGGLIGFGASLLGRYLLDSYAFPVNIRLLFWIALGTSAISPFIIASFKEIPYPVARKTESLADFIKAIPTHVRRQPDFRNFVISRSALGLGVLGNAFYALHGMHLFSQRTGSLAIFTMIILLSRSIIGFLWGWLGDRFGYKSVYIIISILILLQGVFAIWAVAPWMFYLIAVCIGGVYAAFRICDANMVFEIAPTAETGRFIGISNTFVAPVMTLAPLLGGALVDIASYRFMFAVVILVGIVSAILTMLMMPQLQGNPRSTQGTMRDTTPTRTK